MEWKDTSSYSRGGENVPHCWTAKAGRLRITVTNGHIYYPGKWVMHCAPFFDTHKLDVDTKEEAQAKAVELVRAEIDVIINDLGQ